MHPLTVTCETLLDSPESDETFRRFISDLLGLYNRLEIIRAGFGKLANLTGIEYTMLVATGHMGEKGPVFVNSLADHLHLSGAFVSLQTNKLAQRGLLEKVKDQEDSRRVQLRLTELSDKELQKIAPEHCKVNDVLFKDLTEKEFNTLVRVMASLVGNSEAGIELITYKAREFDRAG